jgi:hypothetical protein
MILKVCSQVMKYQQSQNNFLIKHNGWDNKTIYNV